MASVLAELSRHNICCQICWRACVRMNIVCDIWFAALVAMIGSLNGKVWSGYFDAPGTRLAPLGGAGGQGLKADLPSVTLVFSTMDGLKAMRVTMLCRKPVLCC